MNARVYDLYDLLACLDLNPPHILCIRIFPDSKTLQRNKHVPQSRHRKINKRKKQRVQRAAAEARRGPSLFSTRNLRIGAIAVVAILGLSVVAYLIVNRPKASGQDRSEERRVGKECRSRWS